MCSCEPECVNVCVFECVSVSVVCSCMRLCLYVAMSLSVLVNTWYLCVMSVLVADLASKSASRTCVCLYAYMCLLGILVCSLVQKIITSRCLFSNFFETKLM